VSDQLVQWWPTYGACAKFGDLDGFKWRIVSLYRVRMNNKVNYLSIVIYLF